MQVPSATSPERSPFTTSDTGSVIAPKKAMLGQEDFLKLLAVQFKSQDPMKPMEDTAFIAQMAQFTALDQSKSLLSQVTQLASNQDLATANTYIGRQVTFDDGSEAGLTSVVSGVQIVDGAPRLMVGDTTYPVSSVLRVEAAPAPTV